MLLDITGPIYTGMWGNGQPFPDVCIRPVPQPPWVKKSVYCEIFDGMHSQTGTYLETPAHWYGDTYPLDEVPLERTVDIPCTVLRLDPARFAGGGRVKITAREIDRAIEAAGDIAPDTAVVVSTGWGIHWRDECFTHDAPYFSADAMRRIIALHPRLLACDSPLWESREDPQGFFPDFYAADILMLAPVVALEQLPPDAAHCTLTALPIRVEGTSCAPCRAFLRFD
ncbi:MAG: cyclase family protein [Clostridiaceae bacterium]|nr:cyclase family protein [Clostridiaceae bacterium]